MKTANIFKQFFTADNQTLRIHNFYKLQSYLNFENKVKMTTINGNHTNVLTTPDDQYADGSAPCMWEEFKRTNQCREFFVSLLKERGCKTVLDIACGTGIDSVLLIEEGFQVTSIDASEEMLKYACKIRWERRKESGFDEWVIRQSNWLTLIDDLKDIIGIGFDAVVCLGNSFPHLEDPNDDKHDMRLALSNIEYCVKPGGLLLIDHRNYDEILDTGRTPSRSPYYTGEHMTNIRTSVTYLDGKPSLVTLSYVIDVGRKYRKLSRNGIENGKLSRNNTENGKKRLSHFQLSYYPHRLESFTELLLESFGLNCKHTIYGDLRPFNEICKPVFYIHLIEKPLY